MIVYTDGSCSSNPNGVGAWAYVVISKNKIEHKKVGRDYVTTSNRMELAAIIEALRDFPQAECIISDSQYAVNCISGKWKARANLDLVGPARELLSGRDILRWVRGHNGNEGNEIADSLCGEEMRNAYFDKNGIPFVEYSNVSADIF